MNLLYSLLQKQQLFSKLYKPIYFILLLLLRFRASDTCISTYQQDMSTESLNCLFCKIAAGNEPSKMVYQDEDYLVFDDIKPAAKYHYLVIPRKHIKNASKLTPENGPDIVNQLVSIGKQVLENNGGDISDVRLGFHWPPFNSIGHLHLHVISPASNMSLLSKTIFKANTFWFVTPERTLQYLAKDSKL